MPLFFALNGSRFDHLSWFYLYHVDLGMPLEHRNLYRGWVHQAFQYEDLKIFIDCQKSLISSFIPWGYMKY